MTERKDYHKELERAKEAARNEIDIIRITISGFIKDYDVSSKSDIYSWIYYYLLTQTEDAVVYLTDDEEAFEIPIELIEYVQCLLLDYDEFILEAI